MKPASVWRLLAACHPIENEGFPVTTDELAVFYEPLRKTESAAAYNRSVPVQAVGQPGKQTCSGTEIACEIW